MSAYELIIVAPTDEALNTLVAQAAMGRVWNRPITGVRVDRLANLPRLVRVSVPAESRDTLDQTWPGSPWSMRASGLDVLARWRRAMDLAV